MKKTYEILSDAPGGIRIGDRRRVKGETVELTPAEAEFLQLDGAIRPVEPASSDDGGKKRKSAATEG